MASVVCNNCDEPHSAPVVTEDGSYGHYCPDIGFVPLDRTYLQAVLPDFPQVIDRLADAFDCRQRKISALHGQTWRIGSVETASEPVMLYFHPTLQSEDEARDLQNALGREVRSEWRLVVTSRGTLPMAELVAVRLDDLVEMDVETGLLRGVSDPGTLAGVPRRNPGGRPSAYGPVISRLIEERINNGQAVKGRNKEAEAVLNLYLQRNPDKSAPSLSSVKEYVTKLRTGQ